MAEKQLRTRIQLKIDTEENWNKAVNFIPKNGEAVVYDKDDTYSYQRIKIGDGVTNVNQLPFVNALGETESTAYSGAAGKALAERVRAAETNITNNTSNITDVTNRTTTLENLHKTTNNTLGLYKMKIANSHPIDLEAVTSSDITGLVEAISSAWITANCTF